MIKQRYIQPVTMQEAEAFAKRHDLAWATGAHLASLRDAMTNMVQAGDKVMRVKSKMDQPAHVFRVAGKLSRPPG